MGNPFPFYSGFGFCLTPPQMTTFFVILAALFAQGLGAARWSLSKKHATQES